ncbi:MAG: hypothetical protein ACKV2O_06690 [Acidimicrobiales bacterium]
MNARAQRQVERCRHLTQLFAVNRSELSQLAVIAGNPRPGPALVTAFADLYDSWSDVDDPLSYLRRRAVASGQSHRRGAVVAWLGDHTDLNDDALADVVGMSPAELSLLRAQR